MLGDKSTLMAQSSWCVFTVVTLGGELNTLPVSGWGGISSPLATGQGL
jgi:hypothetical protein